MAEPQERGQFILDLDLTSGGHLFFLQENSLNGSRVGLGERGLGGYEGRWESVEGEGAEVSGVNWACHPVFVSFDPLKYC